MHFRGNAVGHCWKKGDENANFPTNRESCSDFSLSATLPAVSFDLAINGFFSNQDPMLTNWFPNWWTIETWILVMELSSLGWFLRSWPLKSSGSRMEVQFTCGLVIPVYADIQCCGLQMRICSRQYLLDGLKSPCWHEQFENTGSYCEWVCPKGM